MKRKPISILASSFAALAVLVAGCSQGEAEGPQHSAAIESRLNNLEEQVAQLRSDWEEDSAGTVDLIYEHHKHEVDSSLHVNCDDSNFSWLQSDSLLFPVSCSRAEPYLDGYKLRLYIGNPYSATFTDVKLDVTWGAMGFLEMSLLGEEAPKVKSRSKTVSFSESLRPGTWNELPLVLSPANADEASRVTISLTIGSVQLAER